MPSITTSKLKPNTTALDGPLKIIARHTVVDGNGSYVRFYQKILRRDFSGVEHSTNSAELERQRWTRTGLRESAPQWHCESMAGELLSGNYLSTRPTRRWGRG
jgi:hypothetical protein